MTWSPSNPPKRGGSYARFLVQSRVALPKSTKGVVAMPIVHDWGPVNTFVTLGSLDEFVGAFGQGGDPTNLVYTPGYIAAYNAFKGAGADDPGAATLITYRMASGGAQASVTISNTTPAPALRVRGIWQGTRGNAIGWAVQTTPSDPTNSHDFVVYVDGVEAERYTYAKTNIQSLADKVNATPGAGGSGWIVMDGPGGAAIVTGTALATSSRANLTGGADGITGLTPTDWTNMRTAFEAQTFEVFVPFDLTDSSIQTAMTSWAQLENAPVAAGARSKRFTYCMGGAAGETITTAVTRSAINDPNVVNLGVGTYFDEALGINLSTSQLAPRMAGVIARRGYGSSIFCTHLDDLSIVVGPSDADQLTALNSGVVTLGRDSIGVRFESQVTTYTSDSVGMPKWAYGTIKYVFTMQAFETRVRLQQEGGGMIGRLNVNDDTRETLVGNAQAILDQFVQEGAIQASGLNGKARVVLSTNPPPDPSDDFVGLDWIAGFDRTLNQVRNSFFLS